MSSGCKNGQKSTKVHPVNSACARRSPPGAARKRQRLGQGKPGREA
ncbi:hypothetical protein A2U01_0084403, partial [Trifolium medium]|nr:hypothetical protein [Trifolium medium]